MKRLGNLHPKWLGILRQNSGEGISFDCPNCKDEKSHSIVAYFQNPLDGGETAEWIANGGSTSWRRSGGDGFDFHTLSLAPSIKYPCFHGWLEVGRVFDIKDSPIVVLGQGANGTQPIALSPLQTIEGCQAAIDRAKVLLGDGVTGENPPAILIKASDGIMLMIGETKVRFWPGSTEADEEMSDLVMHLNAFFGYLPDDVSKLMPRIERPQAPPAPSIIIPGA